MKRTLLLLLLLWLTATIPTYAQSDPPLLTIGEIQGKDDRSPYRDKKVQFRAVVTGLYADYSASSDVTYHLVYVQDIPGMEDGDEATSDGMALFLGKERPSLNIGDQVLVNGRLIDYYGLSEIDDNGISITVEASDVPLPDPIPITPPDTDTTDDEYIAYYERYESMLVTLEGEAVVVGPTYGGCSFTVVSAESGIERLIRSNREDSIAPLVPVMHTNDTDCDDFLLLKSGDRVTGLTGPLTYSYGQYKIVEQAANERETEIAPTPPLPVPPAITDAQFIIASFNMENYFDAIDDTGDNAEPKPTLEEIAHKQAKISYTIGKTLGCPTVLAVQEVENEALLLELAEQTAVYCPFTYTIVHYESADGRGIDVALMVDPSRVTVTDSALRQTCTRLDTGITDPSSGCKGLDDPLFSRPPLQADIEVDGQPYTIFVNHFKSKRGGEEQTTPRRIMQAMHLNELTLELTTANPEARVIVLGDFNDYDQSPPLARLGEQLTSIMDRIPEEERYSYIYSGAGQLLDNVFVSAPMLEYVDAVMIQHVNADYPYSWGEGDDAAMMPYRSTDHDLPLVVVNLPAMPVEEEVAITPEAEGVEMEATAVLKPTTVPSQTADEPAETEKSVSNFIWMIGGMLSGFIIGAGMLFFNSKRSKS